LEMHQVGGYNSAMFVPLKSKGRVVGSLNLGSNREDNFSEKELQVAQRIAEQMSAVVENAVLYEESKQSEETLRRLNKQLEEANRHKSEFLANMSHELRSPLNAILGASELLGDELFGPLNQKQAEYIQDIHQCGNHLLSLINDVLDLSKVEAGKLDLDLNFLRLHSLMGSSATIVRERAASKSLEFQVVPPAEDIVFEADERKIKQIIYNLLSNAVKFTPEQGKVTFSARREGNAVVFVVEDTGPGVAREWQERIFEEFVQAPGSREGTGLGLAVSKKLVELHGGCIWLESQVGQGSRFFFTIPIREEAAARSQGLGISQ
jgi:signal transduction histidine kinase